MHTVTMSPPYREACSYPAFTISSDPQPPLSSSVCIPPFPLNLNSSLHCLDKWYKALDTKKYVGAVFLNISKAFDTVSHELLLSKLTNLRMYIYICPPLPLHGSELTEMRGLLSNRSQITRVLDSYSSPGSPRALSLVPLCFLPSLTTFPLFFLSTQLFSSLMIQPSL